MTPEILLSLKIYALAIAISMVVALLIRGIVVIVSATGRKPVEEEQPASPPAEEEGHIAAISAAIFSMVGAHRIVHISAQHRGIAWTVEGRYAHHSSHAVPHKPRKHKE